MLCKAELPYLESKNVSKITPLVPGAMVIIDNGNHMYLGEVLDIFKKVGRLHGYVDRAEQISGLSNIALRVYLPLDQVRTLNFHHKLN